MTQISEAKYPVTILDKNLKFSPRLFDVSTVVYNNEMLAYGGRTGLSFGESNSLFKYSFDLENKYISMDTMNQSTPGPKCTSCGAVMISQDKMFNIDSREYSHEWLIGRRSRKTIYI
jgi:hypothetical protein